MYFFSFLGWTPCILYILGCCTWFFWLVTLRKPEASTCPKWPAKWNPNRVWFKLRACEMTFDCWKSNLLLLMSKCIKDLFFLEIHIFICCSTHPRFHSNLDPGPLEFNSVAKKGRFGSRPGFLCYSNADIVRVSSNSTLKTD